MKNLTKQEILSIPLLKEQGLTTPQIASKLGVQPRTIQNWAKTLRKAGHPVKKDKVGKKRIVI